MDITICGTGSSTAGSKIRREGFLVCKPQLLKDVDWKGEFVTSTFTKNLQTGGLIYSVARSAYDWRVSPHHIPHFDAVAEAINLDNTMSFTSQSRFKLSSPIHFTVPMNVANPQFMFDAFEASWICDATGEAPHYRLIMGNCSFRVSLYCPVSEDVPDSDMVRHRNRYFSLYKEFDGKVFLNPRVLYNHSTATIKTRVVVINVPPNAVLVLPHRTFFLVHPNYEVNLHFVTCLVAVPPEAEADEDGQTADTGEERDSDPNFKAWRKESRSHPGLRVFVNPFTTKASSIRATARSDFKKYLSEMKALTAKDAGFEDVHSQDIMANLNVSSVWQSISVDDFDEEVLIQESESEDQDLDVAVQGLEST